MINKLKENIFLKSTIILLIGGIFGKSVGFILKIIVIRALGTHGMGLYSILSPTSSLLSTIAVLSYPTAISKIISEKSSTSKDILVSLIPFSIIINIFIIIIVSISSKYLAGNLLKNSELYLPIICLSLTMPFISISSIIKGYFWGKQNMFPYMLSNFLEQITRFTIIILFISKINNIIYKICFLILVNIIGEIISQIVMVLFFPKFKINNIKININSIKNAMSISIPATMSKLIGTFSYFLEPIILTNILLYVGYTKDYIVYEYGVVNAYALSILLMPQFFTQNMSTSLVPELSKQYSLHNYELCKKRIKQIILISCFIGGISTIIITIFPSFFLKLLYNTNEGIDYIRLLSPFTLLFYIEYPLINAMQALSATKRAFKITIINSSLKLITIVLLSLLKIGMYSLILSIIINLIIATYQYYREIKKILHF
ncbi:MAG: oligosaccharide flippase family protein [bacterium]|nr:oligosaccharide flippase family protein [bacterium]